MSISLPHRLDEGRSAPMGALARDGGVNFVVFSDHAQAIELCLFDSSGARELRRYRMHGPHDGLFHGFLPGVGPGLVYGLRAHGLYQPEAGHRFNANKLLLDPWAREIIGRHTWRPEHNGHSLGHPDGHRSFDTRDNAMFALKARVAAPPSVAPGWLNAPRVAPSDLVLYEVHVKSFSQQMPDLPPELRGTYAGLAHPACIAHFKALGVTTLSLLPVQQHLDEPALADRGKVNHWGYNTIGFFCADPVLASRHADPAEVAAEFRQMVATLHEHGLEVVLDVVYNHTAEGSEAGSTLSFRGLDHASWYRLLPEDRSRCDNTTGCGNTVRVSHPRVTQFVLDSLRFWALEMGVDGFRFDLATVLGRTSHGYDAQAPFFTALRQDPVLAQVHLIAEPWDAGHGGYQVGRFPGNFLEWNDKFRDSVRLYWLNKPEGPRVGRGEFARRFTASSDLFHHAQRRPSASINFIAAHDGFTLADLVSYRTKHNTANGEGNRDGRDGEPCADFGVEGPTTDPGILATRSRVQRAMLATLLLAQGTPMLNAGDEIGKTQLGNNNAWCQDNATSWLDWAGADRALAAFVGETLALRRAEPALRHDDWFQPDRGAWTLRWLGPAGHDMQVDDWHHGTIGAFACLITGHATSGTSQVPDTGAHAPLLLCFNPEALDIPFTLPIGDWQVALDSSGSLPRDPPPTVRRALTVPQRSLLVLRHRNAGA
jgi:glycogen operon protein